MVGNKRGKKEKKKSVGTCVGEKKRGREKKKKKRMESPRIWRGKKKRKKGKYYHNIFAINLKIGYY